MRKKGPTKAKMKEIDPQKIFAPQISKKCLGPTRALIRPCNDVINVAEIASKMQKRLLQ